MEDRISELRQEYDAADDACDKALAAFLEAKNAYEAAQFRKNEAYIALDEALQKASEA